MNSCFFGNLGYDDFFLFFGKRMSHGKMPLVWNMNSWVLKKTWFDQFLKTSEVDKPKCPSLTKKNFLSVNWSQKKCSRMQNCISVRWKGCVPLGTWRVPFSTFGVPFGTFKVPIATFRVLNGTGPRHNAHAMVGWLLMIFQCMFRVFMFFEKHLLRLWSWNTLLVSYKLSET